MEFQFIKGGRFLMGTDDKIGFSGDYEGPATSVFVSDFEIATTTVSNQDFATFVQQTGYQTLAERKGNSFVFHLFIEETKRSHYPHPAGAPWWKVVPGTDWAHPYGPTSSIQGLEDHPVVHMALEDAFAYCRWAGLHLPTEAQWEYAARAGNTTTYPWGQELVDEKGHHANTWQGAFPWENSQDDGFIGTAPVTYFEPNQFGLYQMIGNVWEWCCNPRYTLLEDFNRRPFELTDEILGEEYAIRGGSFLCHSSYCNRYRVAARNGSHIQSTTSHLGFRCIREVTHD
ncbi:MULTISPECIES: formylglycine-generating enzyme family protein [unclassified Streptococcus]|uniref:formylglycine-generating enzyme family protein n=1 Tax=unclassified Streptococcus TaxID=2608887 RepID=UPI001071943A|nr:MULTISPECIES: formylglycine-generating enzyme family protein [unclassified Streptococcus]MBF0787004.1 formylglycine-generating enzyme family protein [Streptococcus sp. 19428wC2_LYSM12]MCQ9212616.1 formylglycine-generating enzyme family protein [Streptococcus sp. B01]MCQ9213955.1 formylglycine-generating enzyme family protein [Streptococcus sp. O1]TFV06042.1 formylglycine-generating enzyme family protein [Streptococcus sp. LYSM12]